MGQATADSCAACNASEIREGIRLRFDIELRTPWCRVWMRYYDDDEEEEEEEEREAREDGFCFVLGLTRWQTTVSQGA